MADYISPDALDWSLTHIERFGDTDFFPVPFEYEAIRHCWTGMRSQLASIDLERHTPQSPRRMAIPKPRGDFRIVTQLDPRDCILYTGMIYEYANEIEALRIPVERRIACSYRISPQSDGTLFHAKSGWPEFHQQSKTLCESGEFEFVLVADITDFYNQASQHRIENALELAGIPTIRAKSIERFLSMLAAKHSRGLPVGPNASIVLAEACLADVDMFLLRKDVTFTRYVDDYNIFCRTRSEAIWILHDLCDYLYTAHRLTLNTSKTRVLEANLFLAKELLDPEEEEERGRLEHIQEIVDQMMENTAFYGAGIELEDAENILDDNSLTQAARDNISDMFSELMNSESLHLGVARHVLRRAARLRTNVLNSLAFDNLERLTPVFRDVANYLISTKRASQHRGEQLLQFLDHSDFGSLPFCRIWGIEVLCRVPGIVAASDALRIAENSPRSIADRVSAQVARAFEVIPWIRERKENWSNFGAWDRRAIVFAGAALPRDERNAWLDAVGESSDTLDAAVAKYSRQV